MIGRLLGKVGLLAGAALVVYLVVAAVTKDGKPSGAAADARNSKNNRALFVRGRRIFRYDTFGDQAFWGGALQLHRAIAGGRNGGVGPGVSPKTALSVGLKVDAAAIPKSTAAAIKAGKVNLNDPRVTLALRAMACANCRSWSGSDRSGNMMSWTCWLGLAASIASTRSA